jgi:hypothetical protein
VLHKGHEHASMHVKGHPAATSSSRRIESYALSDLQAHCGHSKVRRGGHPAKSEARDQSWKRRNVENNVRGSGSSLRLQRTRQGRVYLRKFTDSIIVVRLRWKARFASATTSQTGYKAKCQ